MYCLERWACINRNSINVHDDYDDDILTYLLIATELGILDNWELPFR